MKLHRCPGGNIVLPVLFRDMEADLVAVSKSKSGEDSEGDAPDQEDSDEEQEGDAMSVEEQERLSKALQV